ncbi:hypothetical protein [Acetobacter orientalis]|uniref:Uncharacterized protein n=1 Tax=Acetobacter orientalis TaxID=146474 RepID=A0A0D6NK29_9PROT|nr:hypothetical protein [Acetobacter orientalis]GAN65980.1 hypothetical protein Abor_014_145 [Acetobacter orientalis]GBR17479.1 hypothetical protein AA0481_1372 [Acetobacter orientalis NRIC 0481]GEL60346.1 hypothetical protein AOR02nite_01880 [Acetobacter orientalis]
MKLDIKNVIATDDSAALKFALAQAWEMRVLGGWEGRMLVMQRDEHTIKIWHRPDGVAEFEIDDFLVDLSARTKIAGFLRSLMPASACVARGVS